MQFFCFYHCALLSFYFLIAGISFLIRPEAGPVCESIKYLFNSVKKNFPEEFKRKFHAAKLKEGEWTHHCPYAWATQGNARSHKCMVSLQFGTKIPNLNRN